MRSKWPLVNFLLMTRVTFPSSLEEVRVPFSARRGLSSWRLS
jgi:hypothetical protein